MHSVLYIKLGKLSFGNHLLWSDININIEAGDRICLIGDNGAGKTSFMKVLSGEYTLDEGKFWLFPKTNVVYMEQKMLPINDRLTVSDYLLTVFSDEEDANYKLSMFADGLGFDLNLSMGSLSGGTFRKVMLASVLLQEPELLLLDEPTNHLDLSSIEWLENYLQTYTGAVVCISHDRYFLARVTNKLMWIYNQKIHTNNHGFSRFDRWSNSIISQQLEGIRKLETELEKEEHWLLRGVTGRRKRNEGRLEKLEVIRDTIKKESSSVRKYEQHRKKLNLYNDKTKAVKRPNEIVILENVSHSFENKIPILKDFSFSLYKGDRIGIVGKNGLGKTTLIKIMTGQMESSFGKVSISEKMVINYFSQIPDIDNFRLTVKEYLSPSGGDTINVLGKIKYIAVYLKEFAFNPNVMHMQLVSLSGGQITRLRLAKTLSIQSDLLVLDEPTNDLDMVTIDNLSEILFNYKGTIIVISHDRSFLDNVVQKLLSFEGDGVVDQYIGSYKDYLSSLKVKELHSTIKQNKKNNNKNEASQPVMKKQTQKTTKNKLSFKHQYELKEITEKITSLTNLQKEQNIALCEKNLYEENYPKFMELTKSLKTIENQLKLLEERWLVLEESSNE